ncbi:hypothetical protein HMPREF1142_2170 [Peptostreptococcaceae bacterium AS15]|nr:hypothetical protein HMPREF1142_2170 [Peptostreptococcaceae bacterium AS15]
MKYLIRENKNGQLVDFTTAIEEYIHKYQDLEELPYKENHYIETYFDEKEKLVKQKYVEIPKTKEQILEEELKKTQEQVEQANKAIEDLVMKNAGL